MQKKKHLYKVKIKVLSLLFVKHNVLNFLSLNQFNTKHCYWNKKNLKEYFISFENIIEVKLKTTLELFRDKYKPLEKFKF